MDDQSMKRVMEIEQGYFAKQQSYAEWKIRGRPASEYMTGFGVVLSDLSREQIRSLVSAHITAEYEHSLAAVRYESQHDYNAAWREDGVARIHSKWADGYRFRIEELGPTSTRGA